jgi:hypothetical protein
LRSHDENIFVPPQKGASYKKRSENISKSVIYSSGQYGQSFNPENYPKKKYNTNDTYEMNDGHRGSQAVHRQGRRGQELSFSENPDSQEKKFKARKPTLVTETNSTEANIQKKY